MYKSVILDSSDKFIQECHEVYKKALNQCKTGSWKSIYVVKKPLRFSYFNRCNHIVYNYDNLLSRVFQIVNNNLHDNIHVTDKNPDIELHISDGDNLESSFDIHTDNDNGDNVYTFIVYLITECVGGNLAFYKSNKIIEEVDIRSSNDTQVKCLLFSGDVQHKPLKCSGKRVALSFQLKVV